MKKLYENLTVEEIITIINDSNNYDEALLKMGYKSNNANRKIIKELALKYNLSLDHFINKQTDNLLNQRFGKLTVIKKVASKNNGARWLCQCDCGKIKEVDANHLKRNNIISCGCLVSEHIANYNQNIKLIDLTGQRFGKLIVLYRTNNIGEQPAWICKCDCGTITHPILGSNLRKGTTQSCGCLVSRGEAKIRQILNDNSITFNTQITFEDCVSNNKVPLKFDFGVYNDKNELEYLIEYQGIQHYYEVEWTHDSLTERQERDNIKLQYCKLHSIPLKIIPYTKFETLNINDLILQEAIK